MKFTQTIFAAALTYLSGGANALVLTFDELGPAPGISVQNIGNLYSSGGFQISGTAPFIIYGSTRQEWTGSTGLTLAAVAGTVELKAIDGSPFAFNSIDLARGDSNAFLITVNFDGLRADGTHANAAYAFSDTMIGKNNTFSLGPSFASVTSVSWHQGAIWSQFDNVNISAVPETPTVSLLALGFVIVLRHGLKNKNRVAIAA